MFQSGGVRNNKNLITYCENAKYLTHTYRYGGALANVIK